MTTYEQARAAVRAGTPPEEAAGALVAGLTPDELLWCLDGDAPTWAGLAHLGQNGYHQATFVAGRIERVGFPGIAFSDGPRGVVIGNGHRLPGVDGPGCDLGSRPGRAGR